MTQPTRPGGPPTSAGTPRSLAGRDPDGRVIDLATPEWCWSRLRSTTEGVLSSRGARRPAARPVRYTVDDGQVLIPIGSFSAAAPFLATGEVTLGLTGLTGDGLRWVVRATGVALLSVLRGDLLAVSRTSHPAYDDAPLRSDALLMTVRRLRGYHETPLHPDEPR